MRHSLKPYALIIAALVSANSSLAATNATTTQQKKLAKMSAEIQQLEQQMADMKGQMRRASVGKTADNTLKVPPRELKHIKHSKSWFGPKRFLRGVTVTTSPWLGIQSAYDAGDLLYEVSSNNEDLTLLEQRQQLEHELNKVGDSLGNRALVEVSGGLEGQAIYNDDFTGDANGSIDLSNAEIDIVPMVSTWASGFFSLAYDSSPASTGSRNPKSTIYLKRGFLTIGNLDRSPIYFSIGEMYSPYGRYSSAMLTAPLTLSMMRILAPTMRLGFFKKGFYGAIYGFDGSSNTGNNFIRQGGLNFGYKNKTRFGHIEAGIGYVTNIADSQGMQNNGLTNTLTAGGFSQEFSGFENTVRANNTPGNNLAHSVGGGDAHLEVGYHNWYFVGEFMTATRRFAPTDLTYANRGALPASLHTEIDYTWHVGKVPWTLGVAYGQTWQALALNLPKNSYWVLLSTSLWKDTVEGVEYRHDVNYPVQAAGSATGAGIAVPTANVGGTRNMVTFQVGVYF